MAKTRDLYSQGDVEGFANGVKGLGNKVRYIIPVNVTY